MFGNFFGSTKTVFDSLRGSERQEGAPDAPSSRGDSRGDSQRDSQRQSRRGSHQDTHRTATDVDLMYSSEGRAEPHGRAQTVLPDDLGEALDVDGGRWECAACTFLNDPALASCEVCGSQRGAPPAEVSAPEPAPAPAVPRGAGRGGSGGAPPGEAPPAEAPQGRERRERREKKEKKERREASQRGRDRDPPEPAPAAAPVPEEEPPPARRGWEDPRPQGYEERQVSGQVPWQDSPASSTGPRRRDALGATHAAVSSSAPAEAHRPPHARQAQSRASSDAESLGRTQVLPRQQHRGQQRPQPSQQPGTVSQRMHNGAVGGGLGGRLRLRVLRAFNLRNTDIGILPEDVSDPFVVARMGRQEFKTQVIENNLNPVWNSAQFEFAVESDEATLHLEVFNSNQWHAHDSLGKMQVLVQNLTPGENHTVLERLDEGEAAREDGLQAKLEVEVRLLTREQLAGAEDPAARPGGQQPAAAAQQRAPNWVPLPSFHGFGPEAFQAPRPALDDAPVGRQRRLEEYESMASRLGQYDYSSEPAYYPKQEETDKRSWKDDPFYGWRRDLQRQGQAPGAPGAPGARPGRSVLGELNDRNDDWHRDPFHGWLKPEEGEEEQGLERAQEARVARELLALPSFEEADVKRFGDHRDYAGPHRPPRRERWSAAEERGAPEQRWREDAFFGWLPGRGPEGAGRGALHRPLEQARLSRLPSFSEDPALRGITGRGVGVLRVWVNAASDLAYSEGSGLRGKPSACVRLKVGRNREQVTATVPTTHDPCWNAPPALFEVESTADRITFEVVDLANPRSETHLHQYFLGRLELDVREVLDLMAQQQQARGERLRLREELHGSQRQAQLDFELLYEPYDTEAPAAAAARPRRPNRMCSSGSFKSTASSDLHGQGQLGMLSVRVVAAYDLVNTDTGILGDVSDPYVTLRLGSQPEKQRKRTHTINNDLNPTWNSSPFLFPVLKDDDTLRLEVYDEDTFSSDDFLGRLTVPLYRIVCGQPNRAVRIRDRLQDIQHGELEVEIGFSPG